MVSTSGDAAKTEIEPSYPSRKPYRGRTRASTGGLDAQSVNAELLASKLERSVNEELTVLNSQLQDALKRQLATSNHLQNMLYSTAVAMLYIDTDFKIRFFTPAARSLFNIVPADVGRPLAELGSLAADGALLAEARMVLQTLVPLEQEVEAQSGAWYIRRILPYRTQDNEVDGVVITFVDITGRKHAADVLEAAMRQAERANAAKSRFLAAASHDLRQPLQTLSLVQGILARKIEENKNEEALKLVARMDQTAAGMSGMLNGLLDINQIEAGTVHAEMVVFPIESVLDQLQNEFIYQAQAKGLALRVPACGLSVHSDPRLLGQIIRNLLSNALKYTKQGKVVLGCRRRKEILSIEIWDTGIGIPNEDLHTIFEEYHQLDNAGHERNRGVGLGLSIVQRLGNLLGCRVGVRSRLGKGSVFTIEVALAPKALPSQPGRPRRENVCEIIAGVRRTGAILVIENDPEMSASLKLVLMEEGHRVVTAPDGVAALKMVAQGTVRPDVILTDFHLPKGMNGLKITAKLREKLHRQVPVIILTGDISTGNLLEISMQDCMRLSKPVKSKELAQVIQRLLPVSRLPVHPHGPHSAETASRPVIFVIDDDSHVREAIRAVLMEAGETVEDYPTCEAFLEDYHPNGGACLLIDAYLPGMSGLQLLQRLREAGDRLPAIMITGDADVSIAIQAMKAGASDFIEKPIGRGELLACIERALEQSRDSNKLSAWRETAANHIAGLTQRQRQVMELVLAGKPSKIVAADLGISQRTVENHRASIMKRTGSKSLPELARLALAAVWNGAEEPQMRRGSPLMPAFGGAGGV